MPILEDDRDTFCRVDEGLEMFDKVLVKHKNFEYGDTWKPGFFL